MTTLQVFEPGACCSSGGCGPDPEKATFEADLAWAEGQGVTVARHDSSADLGAFVAVPVVMTAMEQEGTAALPMVMAGEALVSKGGYPSREDLARALGLAWEAPATLLTPAIRELVALGASVAAHCEPCFRHHYDQARRLGASKEDMLAVTNLALQVQAAPHQALLATAERYLVGPKPEASESCGCGSGGCC